MGRGTRNWFLGIAGTVLQAGAIHGDVYLGGHVLRPMSRRKLVATLAMWALLLAVVFVRFSDSRVKLGSACAALLILRGIGVTVRRLIPARASPSAPATCCSN